MIKFIKNMFDNEQIELKKFMKIADEIEKLQDEYSAMDEMDLKAKTVEFKNRIKAGETLDDVLVEAFATVREAAKRTTGQTPFYVQILGAIAIHKGNIAEMKTGEGKTLSSVLPAYLNALNGESVHIITVNEYLADVGASTNKPIYDFLGISVGVNKRALSKVEKRKEYECDIMYSTNSEIGFDYLRDNMVVRLTDKVQRGLSYAIIDEVDSILIDEARTPLIISGGSRNTENVYVAADSFSKTLKNVEDYLIDEKTKSITLTDLGVSKAEKYFNEDNLYDIKNTSLLHFINQALKANYIMLVDIDYVVQEDKILIVDSFTGRLMKGRAFSEGLHQAIEAKEKVTINKETKTMATITLQNLFRMYKKLSGMTGTAKGEEEEFRNIYNMYVISIPTNMPVAREDLTDLLYANMEGKFNAIVNEIERRHKLGQPILVGTIAVETSEYLSKRLNAKNIKHEVLNAKNHLREAEIVANAGLKNAVTIATNMAGRGTDIKLGDGVKELGGLCVIGTERHDSRRIDDQLRGRSGRQGDSGVSQFFVSFEDTLMRRFGADRTKNLLQTAGLGKDQAIRSKMFTKAIENAQKRVEGSNYDSRKTLLEYDDVLNKQRELIYIKRNDCLEKESIHDIVLEEIKGYVKDFINKHVLPEGFITKDDDKDILAKLNDVLLKDVDITIDELINKSHKDLIDYVTELVIIAYEKKLEKLPEEVVNEFEKAITLRVLDTYWIEHMTNMDQLKEGIFLRGYAQTNPLQAYIIEGYELYNNMMYLIQEETVKYIINSKIQINVKREEVETNNMVTNDKGEGSTTVVKNKQKRNDLCSCGSGKKYKKCCGINE